MSDPDVNEPDLTAAGVIDPEPGPPGGSARRRRALVAGVTVLALVAGGVAVTAGRGGGSKPARLALLAGSGSPEGRSMAAAADSSAVGNALPAVAPADGKRLPYPIGGWGLTYKVAGDLPDLPDHAAAWHVSGPAIDEPAMARIAGALGVHGTPTARDGGWSVDGGDWTLAATPAGDTWSLSLYRSRFAALDDAASPAGGSGLTTAQAEQRVRDLIAAMGAPAATWQAQVTETQIGPGWACAAPAQPSPELTKEEVDKLRLEQNGATVAPAPPSVPTAAAPAPAPVASGKPAPVGGATPACPPPPAPGKGFNVSLFPVLDGHRAEWALWNVTLRADGQVENLYGSWASFAKAGDYKLRGVDAAQKDLTSPAGPVLPMAVDLPATSTPPVVTITGVEIGLLQAAAWEDGKSVMVLVPAYRFAGQFDNGSPWETAVIALHPDAIAPPPDMPVAVDGRETGGTGTATVGTAVLPTPPDAAPLPVSPVPAGAPVRGR